ncbi:major facilitator superfamily domain-containing protein [Chiua virens]|nr:major facilitator superfamily domain-containing protein [Chiua virens]
MIRMGPDHTNSLDGIDAPNESTRLLPGEDEERTLSTEIPGANPLNAKPLPTPLPKAQLGALIAVRIADPIAYQQIFPYVNQFIADLRITEPDQVGFYSGLVESAYSLAQVLSVYQWGKISDIIGRRPVVFIGLVGIAVTTTTFGLSTTFAGIVASRFFGGLVSGNVAVIHSILGEITDDTNQDFAVPIYSLSWPTGTIIGPLIGGMLANAATRYPRYFSWPIFVKHPYLPPCIVSAACALLGASLGYMLIKETLPSKRKDGHSGARTLSAAESHNNADSSYAENTSVMALLSIPAIRALTISGFALSFLNLSFDVVFTLFCYTPLDAGGLGLEPAVIGDVFASAGLLSVFLRLFAMPYILRHFDYAKTYNVCMYIWPVTFILLPPLNFIARANAPSAPASALMWTGLLVVFSLSKVAAIPHTLSMLLIKQHAPSPSALGRSNGLVQFAMCIARAVAPIMVSTLFTGINGIEWVQRHELGWIWVVVMVVGAILGAGVTRRIGSGTGSINRL